MQIQKALVSFAVEQTILDFGGISTLDLVSNRLFLKYHCSIVDCYEKPQYLNDVSHEIFGKTHFQIIESIKNNLDEFTNVKQINKFLKVMSN